MVPNLSLKSVYACMCLCMLISVIICSWENKGKVLSSFLQLQAFLNAFECELMIITSH